MSTHTAGPWEWRKLGSRWVLCTPGRGMLIVMDFVRCGMQFGQPRFAIRSDNLGGIMRTAGDLGDISEHPDARVIAAAPDLLTAAQHALECLVIGEIPPDLAIVALQSAIGQAIGEGSGS